MSSTFSSSFSFACSVHVPSSLANKESGNQRKLRGRRLVLLLHPLLLLLLTVMKQLARFPCRKSLKTEEEKKLHDHDEFVRVTKKIVSFHLAVLRVKVGFEFAFTKTVNTQISVDKSDAPVRVFLRPFFVVVLVCGLSFCCRVISDVACPPPTSLICIA